LYVYELSPLYCLDTDIDVANALVSLKKSPLTRSAIRNSKLV